MENSPGIVTENSVERRFSDFAWLQQQLVKHNRGVLVPPLPDKKIIGALTGDRFSGDFISERSRGLEKFLNRLAVHAVLQNAPQLTTFLTASDEELAGKKQETKTQPAQEDRGIMNFFRESVQSISNTFGAGAERPKDQDDLACDAVVEYATLLEKQLEKVHTSAEEIVGRTRGLSKCWFEFALSCTLLGQYESKNEEEALGQVCSKLGNTADRLSILLTQKSDDENAQRHLREDTFSSLAPR